MSDTLKGVVINLNAYGATVRLDGGDLATASASDVAEHRDQYQRSHLRRKHLAFEVRRDGRRRGEGRKDTPCYIVSRGRNSRDV